MVLQLTRIHPFCMRWGNNQPSKQRAGVQNSDRQVCNVKRGREGGGLGKGWGVQEAFGGGSSTPPLGYTWYWYSVHNLYIVHWYIWSPATAKPDQENAIKLNLGNYDIILKTAMAILMKNTNNVTKLKKCKQYNSGSGQFKNSLSSAVELRRRVKQMQPMLFFFFLDTLFEDPFDNTH